MRASNVTLKTRNTVTLSGFKGVDMTSSPYEVSANRAVEAVNLIYENGMDRKRKGWRQRYFFGSLYQANIGADAEINGIFHYKTKGQDVLLIHSGSHLSEIGKTGRHRYLTPSETEDTAFPTGRSQFFMNKEKCYIVGSGGDIWVYGTWNDGKTYEVRTLASLAYIPTTTISIDWEEANDAQVAFYESPNLLTPWRKNQIRTQETSDTFFGPYTYELDAPIEPESDVTVEWIGFGKENAEVLARNGTKEEGKDHTNLGLTQDRTGKTCLITDSGMIIGVLDWGNMSTAGERRNATVTMFYGTWKTPSDGSDNMAITFCVDSRAWQYQKEMITDCSFGILFGSHGNTDRLFLSGNPAYPNRVFFSGFDDPTYFPDINYVMAGSDHVPVNGMVRLHDDTLAVLKPESDADSTVFYVTGTLQNQYDSGGSLTFGRTVFTIASGGAGEGNLSPYTPVNLAGDALFLSSGGVFGIALTENVTVNARNVRERSWSVNGSLRQHDGSDAAGIVLNDRYYLSMDGVCYVADAAHKYMRSGNDLDQSFNYEWWYWENIPARTWAVVNGVLWFGTHDGRVCSLDGEGYEDSTFYPLEGIGYSTEDNAVYYDTAWEAEHAAYAPKVGDGIRFDAAISAEQRMYAKLAHVTPLGDVWQISAEEMGAVWEGREVWIGTSYAEESDTAGTVFRTSVREVDRGACTVRLLPLTASPLCTYADGSADLFLYLNGRDLSLTAVADGHFQLALPSDAHTPLNLVRMQRYLELPEATLTQKSTVCARWVTPYLALGSNLYSKTLLRLSLTAGVGSGRFGFGYQTKRLSGRQTVRGVDPFRFDALSFARFGFGNSFAASHTVRMRVRDVNYVRFCFVSEEAEEMCVDSLTLLYKINGMNQGVR